MFILYVCTFKYYVIKKKHSKQTNITNVNKLNYYYSNTILFTLYDNINLVFRINIKPQRI